ncbi:hypothetical protein Droror1_Dr00000785 [Drosera rotundifolia]
METDQNCMEMTNTYWKQKGRVEGGIHLKSRTDVKGTKGGIQVRVTPMESKKVQCIITKPSLQSNLRSKPQIGNQKENKKGNQKIDFRSEPQISDPQIDFKP